MNRQLKVGIFVIVGLALTMVAVFLIGDTSMLWHPKVDYETTFEDVDGLKPGAPVRMGGLDIGHVTSLGYDGKQGDNLVHVHLSIEKKESSRILVTSDAMVGDKGLLGDKMILVSAGTGGGPLDPKTPIKGIKPKGMMSMVKDVGSGAQDVINNLKPLSETLGDPKLSSDIKGTAADLHALLDVMVNGDGTAHRLFYDRKTADETEKLLADADKATEHLNVVLSDFEDVSTHVREGPGIAHAVVYDGEISKDAAGTLSEIHADLKAIREGNGLAHALFYGDDSSQHVMGNLNAMSDDLRVIVAGVRQGKGTIGALLVDPTVYEDIKSAIGNVERNEVLRALVRYSIKADEQKRP